ncbi:tagaturonate epimerase family protein [Aquibacillus salsiterrae]|uniref:Tagaturonate/fructuronate epimerase n=1 Tax=Aquibacillus salsiterrae TaxID=2950439 RepID=A0A9X4AFC6_9BACI|nr:tagaturonate epimerase family protein [Aquibacillus salsiterrae]MDC3416095.1 tagaturonate epimerase family protein [Aquibacillus salsiterrae]
MGNLVQENLVSILGALKTGKPQGSETIKVYEKSYTEYENVKLVMVKNNQERLLLATGEGSLYDELVGEAVAEGKVCPLSYENRLVLNKYFDYTVPKAFGTKVATMGLGDRLGLASPGHIETVQNRNVKPVLAQQSIRELNLTNRKMTDILDAAAFAVFQEGYKDGFGWDGDHIKEEEDIKEALELGISMLTLDCSDHIPNEVESASDQENRQQFEALDKEKQDYFNDYYLNQSFKVNGLTISYDENTLIKNVLLYGSAIDYMEHVGRTYFQNPNKPLDFEISIDETATVTTPNAHFFVANELKRRGVEVVSLAPRFCGEFQKGIDYIGDIEQFEKELSEHALIAKYFGYKLSIHSGSDKFSVFPIIGKYTDGIVHVKTAGTNWLEAVRVIADQNPNLYRKMHAYAEEHFEETLAYYHITPDLASVAPLDSKSDEELPEYMNHDAARQLLHVTFGILLTAKDDAFNFLFKDEFFKTLNDNEEVYRQALVKHIGKHADLLGF